MNKSNFQGRDNLIGDGSQLASFTNSARANNVSSFALGDGEICYLQNNGMLYLVGNAAPIAQQVTSYGIDAAGSIIYLSTSTQSGVTGSYVYLYRPSNITSTLLDPSPIVKFNLDGQGSAVVLDQNGNLYRFLPGSTVLPAPLEQTTHQTVLNGNAQTHVVTSVANFAIDKNSNVVVLSSTSIVNTATIQPANPVTGIALTGVLSSSSSSAPITAGNSLLLFAPGNNTPLVLDTNISKFAIDGGSIIALDNLAYQSETLANGVTASYPLWSLVDFAGPSYSRAVIETGVTNFSVVNQTLYDLHSNLDFRKFS